MVWSDELILAQLLKSESDKFIEKNELEIKSNISSKRPPRLFEIIASFTEEEFDLFEDLPYNLKTRFLRVEDKELESKLIDSLTGLYGHGARERDLVSFMDFAIRQNQSLSYLTFDLDNFKSINDTYGHPIGDKVLKGVSKIISSGIREGDCAYRQGGEELSILLPNIDIRSSEKLADKLRKKIQNGVLIVKKRISGSELIYEYDVVVGKSEVAEYRNSGLEERDVTTSVGVSTFHPVLIRDKKISLKSNIDLLLENGDIALYKAKNNGRNQVCSYIPKDMLI